MNVIETELRLGMQFYQRQSLVIERGSGSFVWDLDGVKYLDFTSGWGVTCLGHTHPVVIEALTLQANKIMQNPNSGFTFSAARAELFLQLERILPAHLLKYFAVNSGAEANDAALKLARKATGRLKVVSTRDSFHGRTFNTICVSGNEANRSSFPGPSFDTQFVQFDDLNELEQAVDHDTAAVIVEPIQGEGGVQIPAVNYLSSVSDICKRNSALLILDEIQTGFCRTGKMFAVQHSNKPVYPDIMTLGKGVACGYPFGLVAITQNVSEALEMGDHGGTYCGNPLGCKVAASVVDYLIEHSVAEKSAVSGATLLQGLRQLQLKHPEIIHCVRGTGLLTALELNDDSLVQPLTQACQRRKLLVTPTRNGIIRLIPDLLVDAELITQALYCLDLALSDLYTEVAVNS